MPFLRFLYDRDGALAPMFGLLLVPLVGLTGAAIDFSRANEVRASMQASLDATALALSKDAASLTATQLSQKANDYFNANFNRPEAASVVVTPTYTANPSTVTVSASGAVATPFIKIMGIPSLTVHTTSTVTWGMTRLRVALVLDNTGSMAASGKMTALKTAAKSLLTQLQGAASTNGDVYVSIIPFAKDVNVDPVNYNESWIKWSDPAVTDGWNNKNGSCSKDSLRKEYPTESACQSAGGSWTIDNHNTWTGCVMDRDQSYDTTNTAPSSGVPATLFPAEQYSACPVPMMGLSYNWSLLDAKIDAMTPNGGTNQAIGLQLGFQSLTSAPFTVPAMDGNYQYLRVIILLSDGLNTQDRWPAYGNGQTQVNGQIDARQKILCDNVKAAGIILYTVQVNTDGDPTSSLLRDCASDSSKFFILTSAQQIISTFQQIGTQLSPLRISK
jgi:Flp pilus assembly protein TadG